MADEYTLLDLFTRAKQKGPVAVSRNYRVPIYSGSVPGDRTLGGFYVPKSASFLSGTPVTDTPGIFINEDTIPRSIRPNTSEVGVRDFYGPDGPEATIAHELVHHIDREEDPVWKHRVDESVGWNGVLRRLYDGISENLYGNRRGEARAFVASDTLSPGMFRDKIPTVELESWGMSSMGDHWPFSNRASLSPDVKKHPILDSALLAELQQVMYKQLNAKGQAAMKSRQRK